MQSKTFTPIFAICFGALMVVFVGWQLGVGRVYFKSSVFDLGAGSPFLLAEFGMGVYIVVKGIRGIRAGCWPPPPL